MTFKIIELVAIYTAISDVLAYREKSMSMQDKKNLYSVRRKIRTELVSIDNYFSSPGVLIRHDDIETE